MPDFKAIEREQPKASRLILANNHLEATQADEVQEEVSQAEELWCRSEDLLNDYRDNSRLSGGDLPKDPLCFTLDPLLNLSVLSNDSCGLGAGESADF